jgi:hypothetical protein
VKRTTRWRHWLVAPELRDRCSTYLCIASVYDSHGTIVQRRDGEWSHSGNLPGVCSDHGGVR